MKTNIIKKDFKGQVLYIGMDVHKLSWTITIMSENLYLKRFTQNSDPQMLIRHLKKNYPGATYKCVYEAGYCGYWIAERLKELGAECTIVNPADIPTTNKQKDQKTDKSDSKKLAELLRAGLIHGIYLPSDEDLEARLLLRIRYMLVKQQAATKNRIKSLLCFFGIPITDQQASKHWTKRFMEYLREVRLTTEEGQYGFEVLLRSLDNSRVEVLKITKRVRELARSEKYRDIVSKLITTPGVGVISAMTIQTEIMDKYRFTGVNKFRGYIGLIPKEHSSGGKENKGEITKRSNKQTKTILIESAWVAVRTDPAMTLAFEELIKRMNKSKAIIRIARKLANRVLHILKTEEQYVLSVA